MVEAVIRIPEETNRVLNIIKAKYGLKDKSAAIIKAVETYEDELMEPALRPEYEERIKTLSKKTDKKKKFSSKKKFVKHLRSL